MTTHYDKSPITEAIIDVQVTTAGVVSLGELEQLQSREGAAYPERKVLLRAKVDVDIPGDETEITTQTSKDQHGWAFFGADKRHVWQVRRDGFTFSRLAPYESWEPFSAEARRLWAVTRDKLQPGEITRIALRYINRIELPLPMSDLKDYLRTVPEVSPALPQGLANFFMQLQIPLADIDGMVTLNQTMLPPASLEAALSSAAVLLDIDVYRAGNIPADDDGLWTLFERLHLRHNSIFEGCITDRTRELIS